MKEKINIVWFKRDFRLSDHQPLCQAVNSGLPTLLIAFLEPSLMQAPQSDVRHWRFIFQSVKGMNTRLTKSGHHLFLFNTEVVPFLQTLSGHFQIRNIFSYAETGIAVTYERDKKVKEFCEKFQIRWVESPYAGVIRGIKRRKDWPKYWYSTMAAPTEDPVKLKNVDLEEKILNVLPHITIPVAFEEKDKNFQEGGESKAQLYLTSFLDDRVARYNQHVSKPLQSRKSCSRLSPYLAWGNVSMRQVYQAAMMEKRTSDQKWNINTFASRLRWHCHFIQKFEMMVAYENQNINPGYDDLRNHWNEEKYLAWENGLTGYPLVDACMRCVKTTGYINFRMRSMLVSFLTHHLWLPWKRGADFLAK